MANVYVRSLAAGAGTGADWANAYTTLAAALTAKAAGDSFWVADDHAETQASAMTLASPGTSANPCFVYCVDRAGSVPPVSADLRTTATISTTGNNGITISTGCSYWYGITFNTGNSTGTANLRLGSGAGAIQRFKSCNFRLIGTGGSSMIISGIGNAGQDARNYWDGCTVQFGATGQIIRPENAALVWRNSPSAISGSTFPTTLFSGGTIPTQSLIEGVDLSALGSGVTLVGAQQCPGLIVFKDCKLGASVTVAATPTTDGYVATDLFRSDSAGTNYRSERYRYAGTETVETTIVRTGGASDGTTSIAKKIVTTANSKWAFPFETIPVAIWNDSTGSVTVTVYGIWGGGAVPLNDEIWIDVEYLGAAGNPLGSFISSSKADNLATGSNTTSDSSTWGGSTTKFKMSVTFTPAQKGAIYVYVKAAKASSTFYIDPKPVLS